MSDSLHPHGLWHTGLPCPSLSARVCFNSCVHAFLSPPTLLATNLLGLELWDAVCPPVPWRCLQEHLLGMAGHQGTGELGDVPTQGLSPRTVGE